MKNNNKSNGFGRFVKEKGYYIVLLLCAAAVGASGYFLLSGRTNEPQQEVHLSANSPTKSTSGNSSGTEPAADAVATGGKTVEPTEPGGTEASHLEVRPPVAGEPCNTFAADFLAYNETTRDWRTHEGLDLSAAVGEEVVAAAAGSVYTVYEDESLGMTVVLRHTNGYTTHYSNLDKEVAVSVGDNVEAGTVLGTVGQTAGTEMASVPHLHFAVYQNNTAIDPAEFLKLS